MKFFTRSLVLACSILFITNPTLAQRTAADTEKALRLVQNNAAAMALTDYDMANALVSDTYTTPDGLTMVYLQQAYKGIPVYNQLQVAAFRADKLVALSGGRIAKLEVKANEPNGVASITPLQAVQKAATHLQLQAPASLNLLPADNSAIGVLHFAPAGVSERDITVQALWTPVTDSSVKLTWQVFIVPPQSSDMWLVRVDAVSGTVLGKTNLTVNCDWSKSAAINPVCTELQAAAPPVAFQDTKAASPYTVNVANYRVVPFPAESPIHPGGTHVIRSNPWTAAAGNASTLNWQSDGTTEWAITRGNNVHAHLDTLNNNGNNGPADTSSTPLPELNFIQAPDYTLTAKAGTNRRFALTNLFYWNNIMHDISYQYGFNEVSGNFQANNQSRGGTGNDYVQADAQDGGGTNNANFGTPADGSAPRMQMYLFTYGTPGKDGDLDNGVVSHEYTHGISNRLTGGPSITTCLSNAEQMGEGWSDYFALMVTTNWATATTTDGAAAHPIGNYVLNNSTSGAGIRVYPYSTNMSINPWTYAMMPATSGEVHNIGEVWCAMLWDMTWNMIQLDGINTNIYNPSTMGGNSAALKLVTEGMRLQPCSPGFVDGRNAILKADTLFFNGRYSCAIWQAFARRGLGTDASQGSSASYLDGAAGYLNPSGVSSYSFSPDKMVAGGNEVITYTSSLMAGYCGAATGYYITDTLPANVTYVSGGTYDAANRVVKFTPVNIASGATQAFALKVKVAPNTYFAPVTHITETVPTATIPAAWTAASTVAAGWTTSATRTKSSPYSFFAADPSSVSDKTIATTDGYTLLRNTTLSFWHYFILEAGYDGGVVEITTNGGTTWTDLGPYITANGYTGTIPTLYGSPIGGRNAFTGNSGLFLQTVIDLTAFAGQTVKFRFRLGSDNAVSVTGWYIDDILLKSEPLVVNTTNLYTSANVRQYSGTITTPVNAIVLPLIWGDFTVRKEGATSLLQWSTVQEVNTSHFIVERSSDGLNFTPMATVAAAGNSSVPKLYSAKDGLPLKGANYYRILQKDRDGRPEYSAIHRLAFHDLLTAISLSPNPAKGSLNITIPGNTDVFSAQLISTSGQVACSFTIRGQYTQQPLPVLAAGVYYLKLQSSTQVAVKKVVIE